MTEQGMLYLCATPIGNLSDMTFRVLDTLKEVDLIACEDTRNSMKLLNHFEIKTPLTSYHEYNKYDKADELVRQLLSGKNIALITDAGTCGISDPGEVLVQKCQEAGIVVTSLPGACALITALSMSGLPTRRFCFEAFLPAEKKERAQILEELKSETRTIILYEAPHHLVKTLKELSDVLGNREIALCRELTKRFEEVKRTTLEDALLFYKEHEPKGEYVLVVKAKELEDIKKEAIEDWLSISMEEHMSYYENQGLDRKECMRKVAKDRGISKRDVYQYFLSSLNL